MRSASIFLAFWVLTVLTWAPAQAGSNGARARWNKLVERLDADPRLAVVNKEEAVYSAIKREALDPWQAAWKGKDSAAFETLVSGTDAAWMGSKRNEVRVRGGVVEYSWALAPGKGETGRYLASFSNIADFQLETHAMKLTQGHAELTVRFDLRGNTVAGARRHDRGTLRLRLENASGAWRISAIEPVHAESLESARAPRFSDATGDSELAAFPVTDRKEAIRRGGYAMAVADFDGDKKPDLLVGGFGPMKLYRNTGSGFKDATEDSGLAAETLVKSAALADLDNDGKKDIVLMRFIADKNDAGGDLVVYKNLGEGRFERKGDVTRRSRAYDRAMPLAVADFDSDGKLDMYLGFPGGLDFTNLTIPNNGLAKQGLWLNKGDWIFEEAPQAAALWDAGESVLPHAALATDINGDMKPDLIVLDDNINVNPVYVNDGAARLKDATAEVGMPLRDWAMGIAAGDFDGDGHQDLALTAVNLLDAKRMGAGTEQELMGSRGIWLYRNKGDGTYEDVTETAGMAWAGEALSGVEWLDYDADGHLDLYVANGLWTGGAEDFSSRFVRAKMAHDASYIAGREDGSPVDGALASPFADGLEGNDVLEVLRADAGLSMAGSQRNRLFRNNGDSTFTEVAYLENADAIEDGYMAASGDVDGDGRQDILLRNADPAPGVNFPAVKYLRNTGTANSLTVYAVGRESNADGVGSMVTAWVNGRRIVREIRSANGAVQSEPAAYIGLGDKKSAQRLEVRWPSGRVESFENVAAGRVELREGEGIRSLAAR